MKHVIESQQFDTEFIDRIFAIADNLDKKIDNNLFKGKIMASLFYEPSTRTRFSFETAMLKLGGNVITTENAKEYSSVAKGETLEDTIRTVNQYADIIVLRHSDIGASNRAALVSNVPIINAGDGTGQHPTQALLDLYTIKKELGRLEDIRIAFIGDLKNGRTARSLVYLLSKYTNVEMFFVSPSALQMGQDIKDYLINKNIKFTQVESMESVLKDVDVIYLTRIQKERFNSEIEYNKYKGKYIFTMKEVNKMKNKSIIMHPLPRVDEISIDVDKSPKAVYFKQVRYGVLTRMALLTILLANIAPGGRAPK